MITNANVEKSFLKWVNSGLNVPYWKYCLPNECDVNKLEVFKNNQHEDRLWFSTNYVIPCTKEKCTWGDSLPPCIEHIVPLDIKELSDPLCVPLLYEIFARNDQNGFTTLSFREAKNTDNKIMSSAYDLGISCYHTMLGHKYSFSRHGKIDMCLKQSGEYMKATERWLIGE